MKQNRGKAYVRVTLSLMSAFLAFFLTINPVSALTTTSKPTTGITISPFLQEQSIKSSDTQKDFTVTLTNNTTQKQTLTLQVLDFKSLDETGGLAFTGGNTNQLAAKYGLADWIKLDQSTISLEAGAKSLVTGHILNKDTLSPGGHYAAVLINVESRSADSSNTVNVKQTLSSLIFARKVGGEKYDLRLAELTHDASRTRAPQFVTLRFFNPGNIYNVPRGTVRLLSGNTLVAQGVINEESSFILPESYRQMVVTMRTVENTRLWLVRNYKLSVDYRYDGIDRTINKTVAFKAINTSMLLVLLTVIAVGIILTIILLKRKKRSSKSDRPDSQVSGKVVSRLSPKTSHPTKEVNQKKAISISEKNIKQVPVSRPMPKKVVISDSSQQKITVKTPQKPKDSPKSTNKAKKISVKTTE